MSELRASIAATVGWTRSSSYTHGTLSPVFAPQPASAPSATHEAMREAIERRQSLVLLIVRVETARQSALAQRAL
jgi:hypothetical protein